MQKVSTAASDGMRAARVQAFQTLAPLCLLLALVAFASALSGRPDIALNSPDGHPTAQGTYLAACVIYATLFGKSPVGLKHAPAGIPDDARTFLQRIAAPTIGY